MAQKKQIDKFVIPRQQLTYAIKIHLMGGDLACAHPLAEAARSQLVTHAKSKDTNRYAARRRKEGRRTTKTKRPDSIWIRDYLFDTILLYERVSKSTFPAGKLYTMWYLASNRDLIWTSTPAGRELFNVSERFAVQQQWWAQAASRLD